VRKKYIAGNWKMHKTIDEAKALASELAAGLSGCAHKLMVAPPFTALPAVAEVLAETGILVGAQNMASAEDGAHTGEISVLMLKDLGVDTVILGHSERRHVYGESDTLINEKVKLALKHGLEVIFCVGEKIDERESGAAEKVVESQVQRGLDGVSAGDLGSVTIAYEPVWAIGTGKTATPGDADAMHLFIRKVLRDMYSDQNADSMIIQYGGSVKPANAADLLTMPNIDGALVGGAALDAKNFIPIAVFDKQ
jgi:triosephosphate isomerase (TIM)